MNPLEQQLADQLTLARLHAVTLTAVEEADLTAVQELVAALGDRFAARYGLTLGLLPLLVKAAAVVLRRTPALLGRGADDGGAAIADGLDLSVALPAGSGRALPVVRDCERKTVAELAAELATLAARAQADEITIPELQGGVFTLGEGESDGMLCGTPLLNPPQSAALVIHPARPRPLACGGHTRIRPVAYLALAYDARLVSTPTAAAFLRHFRDALAVPAALLV
jgi:2-oxoglutarate dehydrogenase E2 component (dihydrolipoamide succinyltransferase)